MGGPGVGLPAGSHTPNSPTKEEIPGTSLWSIGQHPAGLRAAPPSHSPASASSNMRGRLTEAAKGGTMAFPVSTFFQNATTAAREDEKVNVLIRSSSAYTGMDVVARLQDCASSDPQHILQPNSGPHVAVIHQALEKLASAALLPVLPSGVPSGASDKDARQFNDAVKALKANTILPAERSQATYGPSTAKAVKAYKTARDIRRTPSSGVDNVVGILTIQTLDRDLSIAALGDLPPVNPPNPGTRTPIDFVIAFIGGVPDSDRDATRASSNLRLASSNFKDLNPNQPNGADFVHTLTGRRLRCIGRGSTTPDSSTLFLSVAQEILLVLRDSSLTRGRIFIRGGSAGGRNALLCATKLSAQLGPLEMGRHGRRIFRPPSQSVPQARPQWPSHARSRIRRQTPL